jgi:hypothetical protein
VVEGLLVRVCRVAGRTSTQVMGPGDHVAPWTGVRPEPILSVTWTAVGRARLALVDEQLLARARAAGPSCGSGCCGVPGSRSSATPRSPP